MAVTIDNVHEGPSPRSVIITYSSDLDNPTFYVWQDGELIYDTSRTSLVLTLQEDQTNVISIFDSADDRPLPTEKSDGLIRFASDESSEAYRVYIKDGITLTLQQEIRKDTINKTHSYRTGRIDDDDGVTFQITSLQDSLESVPAILPVSVIRIPDAPLVSAAFDDGTNKLTYS